MSRRGLTQFTLPAILLTRRIWIGGQSGVGVRGTRGGGCGFITAKGPGAYGTLRFGYDDGIVVVRVVVEGTIPGCRGKDVWIGPLVFVGIVDPIRHPVLLSDVTLVSSRRKVVLSHWGLCVRVGGQVLSWGLLK